MMAFWEFLIQKEGDRSWLPLDSSTMEILEGRYRIVARSSRSNTSVEIRVTHNATTETPPKRRIQKRTSQTNADGLLVIMPYTRLLPGTWELRCTNDLITDVLGKGWQYAVQLDVQPIELDRQDWDDDWQEEEQLSDQGSSPSDLSISSASRENGAEAAIAALIVPTAAALGEPLEIKNSTEGTIATDKIAADRSPHSVRLQLEATNYIVQNGLPLVLTGAIESVGDQEQIPGAIAGKLRVRLFNPQTSQMLVDETQLLQDQSLPMPISLTLALPSNCETHLLLGELALYGQAGQPSEQTGEDALPPVLATQSFSVTTDLLELLNAIANDFPEVAETPEPPPVSSPTVSGANTAFLNLRPPVVPALHFRPATQQPLPPQLHPADPNKAPRSLDLPAFAKVEDSADKPAEHPLETSNTELADRSGKAAPEQFVPESSSTPSAAEHLTDADPLEISSDWLDLPPDLQPQLELIEDAADPAADWQNAGDHLPYWQQKAEPDAPPSDKSEDVAFRSLNLQERFLSKLQSLAGDLELAEAIADPEADEAIGSAIELSNKPFEPRDEPRDSDRSLDLEADLTAHEFVVEAVEPTQNGGSHSTELSRIRALAALSSEPIATPQLEVPNGELAAGQTIPITVRLPGSYARIYAKLWMHDRQSRALLDGPHWLMDFSPDGFGNLVLKSQIMVPFGCLEVQFEAIAIDMTNQRESDKVSVVRTVIPPSLTALSLEELEG